MINKAENFIIETKNVIRQLNEEKISRLRKELNDALEQEKKVR